LNFKTRFIITLASVSENLVNIAITPWEFNIVSNTNILLFLIFQLTATTTATSAGAASAVAAAAQRKQGLQNAALEYNQSRAGYKRRVRKLRHQYKNEHAWHRAKDLAEPAIAFAFAFASNTGGAANCSSGKERANCHHCHSNINCARLTRLQPSLQQW